MCCNEQPVRTALIGRNEPGKADTDTPPLRAVGGAT